MKWYVNIPLKLALFLAVCAVSTFVSFIFLSRGMTVKVPDVRGMSLQETEMVLMERGLSLKVDGEQYDHSVASGYVLEQDLPPGSHVRGQVVLKLVLSKGPEVRLIPSALGLPLAQAKSSFLEQGLLVGKIINVHSDTEAEGIVLAQKPAPEEWSGEAITLVVSSGSYDIIYYCPFFLGMNKRDALLVAADLGLSVVVKDLGGADAITRQDPPAGAEIKWGDTIKFTIGGKSR